MDVPATLRAARRRARLSQAELARRSGTSQATISAYERGRKVPSLPTLDRLLVATGTRLTTRPSATTVAWPSAAEQDRAGRALLEVLALAEALPVRHAPALRFPRLPPPAGSRP